MENKKVSCKLTGFPGQPGILELTDIAFLTKIMRCYPRVNNAEDAHILMHTIFTSVKRTGSRRPKAR